MGSVYNRGTRAKPLWYGQYKTLDGTYKKIPTHKPTKALALLYIAQKEKEALEGIVDSDDGKKIFSDLVKLWKKGLVNRNAADDRKRCERHLEPQWGPKSLRQITIGEVMTWIDDMRSATAPVAKKPEPQPGAKRVRVGRPKERLSDPSIRANLNLLSRFFSWAIERGHASVNPVRQIPMGRRPRQSARADKPWLDDDELVRKVIADLRKPFDLMFYLGNRSGLRTGEIAGLRISDLGFLAEGTIRVRFSYNGPLKEDKYSEGRVKWVPAPEDATVVLGPWLDERKAKGAKPEDLVFVAPEGGCIGRVFVGREWREAAEKHGLKMTFYQATRHSFTSRNLSAGASLDEVSAALGHSSPVVTKRHYDHFVRKTFSSTLRKGIGMAQGEAAQDGAGGDGPATADSQVSSRTNDRSVER